MEPNHTKIMDIMADKLIELLKEANSSTKAASEHGRTHDHDHHT